MIADPKNAPNTTSNGECAFTATLLWAMRTDRRKLNKETMKFSVIYVTAAHAENAMAECPLGMPPRSGCPLPE